MSQNGPEQTIALEAKDVTRQFGGVGAVRPVLADGEGEEVDRLQILVDRVTCHRRHSTPGRRSFETR